MDVLKVIVELTVFTVGIYLVLRFLRETRGSGVVRGLIIVLLGGMVGFFTLIQSLELERLDVVFKEVTATIVLTLVIVFHQEIRRAFVQLGDSQIFGRFFRREIKTMQRLLRSVARLSKERIGALIAIEREGSLATLAETGVHLDAELNSFLIESVFYPGTALHDGAIVVRGDRLVAASCLLPLSQNPDIDKRLGTRHRAAIGLTEETDALAIVVSEETGKISTSVGGKLDYGISLEQLEKAIEEHQRGRTVSSTPKERRNSAFLLKALVSDPYRKLIAVGLAVILWIYLDGQVTHTAELLLDLKPSTSSTFNPSDEGGPGVLLARTSNRSYAIQGFEASKSALFGVKIHTRGTSSELDRLTTDLESIWVELDTKDLADEIEQARIRLEDLRVRPMGLKKLLVSMEPREVVVSLIHNKERTLTLLADIVRWPQDDARLIKEEAIFSSQLVTLRGPAAELDSFWQEGIKFVANLAAAPGPSGLRSGELSLAVPPGSNITMEPDLVNVRVAQKPDFLSFEYHLPVVALDSALSEAERSKYTIPKEVLIKLNAAGGLSSRLKAEKDASWIQKNAFVAVVLVPADLAGGRVTGRLFIWLPEFREGRDYEVANIPPIEIKLKEQ